MRAVDALRRRLAKAEASWLRVRRRPSPAAASGGAAAAAAAAASWARTAFAAAVAALRLSLTRVHVRYEHPTGSTSGGAHPFAAGLTLAMLSSVSVDEHGVEVSPGGGQGQQTDGELEGSAGTVRKAMELRRLAVYMDPDAAPWGISPDALAQPGDVSSGSWDALFGPGIDEGDAPPHGRQYVLAPTSGTLKFTRCGAQTASGDAAAGGGAGSGAAPSQVQLHVALGDVAVSLSTAQCRDAARLGATLSEAAAAAEQAQRAAFDAERRRVAHAMGSRDDIAVAPSRPQSRPGPGATAAWWRYAAHLAKTAAGGTGGAVRPKHATLSWTQVSYACAARRQYLALYRGVASARHPAIARLDSNLPFEVALLFRCLAHLHAERQRAAAVAEAAAARGARAQRTGSSALTRGAGYALRTAAGLVWGRRSATEASATGAEAGTDVPASPAAAAAAATAPDDGEQAFSDALDTEEGAAEADDGDDTFHEAATSLEALEAEAEARAADEAAAAAAAAAGAAAGAGPAPGSQPLMSPEDWAELDKLIAATSVAGTAAAQPSPDALLAQLRVACASASLVLRVSPEHRGGLEAESPVVNPASYDATLRITCAGFAGTAYVYPGRHEVSLALSQWVAVTPDGVFVRSSSTGAAGDSTPSFEATYAKLAPGGRFDHALSATLLPISITASRAAVERLVAGARAASAAVASALAVEQQNQQGEAGVL